MTWYLYYFQCGYTPISHLWYIKRTSLIFLGTLMVAQSDRECVGAMQDKFIYLAPFRHKAIQSASPRHRNAFKSDVSKCSMKAAGLAWVSWRGRLSSKRLLPKMNKNLLQHLNKTLRHLKLHFKNNKTKRNTDKKKIKNQQEHNLWIYLFEIPQWTVMSWFKF